MGEQESCYELVVEGDFSLVRGFLFGYLTGRGLEPDIFFHRVCGIHSKSLMETLKEQIGLAPEVTYFVACGVYTVFGVGSPVAGSEEVTRLMSEGWEQEVGGKLEFIVDRAEVIQQKVDHLTKKRKALGITEYAAGKFGAEKVLMDMTDRRKLEDEQKAKAEAKG